MEKWTMDYYELLDMPFSAICDAVGWTDGLNIDDATLVIMALCDKLAKMERQIDSLENRVTDVEIECDAG